MFNSQGVKIKGIDISVEALRLARRNLEHNVRLSHLPTTATEDLFFEQGDVLALQGDKDWLSDYDVLTANPPYISPQGFDRETSRSVRNYEPRVALVPPAALDLNDQNREDLGDRFYGPLLRIARRVGAKVVMLEVAGLQQALRVAALAKKDGSWMGVEIWRDWPDLKGSGSADEARSVSEAEGVLVRGQGHGRAVICWSRDGARLLGKPNAGEV